MQLYASCAARDGAGVLLVGASGAGKSDLLLRLLDHGFVLVADDRVDVDDGVARPPPALAGLLEVRGLGIVRMPHLASVRLALVAALERGERLPEPQRRFGLPLIHLDPAAASAPARLAMALRCACGRSELVVGALA